LGYGLGGVYMGFKQSGFKGALLGGATGFAGTMAGGLGAGLIISALSLPLTWPVMLIGGLVAGLCGTFTSKFFLGKVFARDKIDKFKNSFKDGVIKELARMRAEDNFSETVRNQVETAFEALKTKIKTETENILNDTQNQLTNLKVELANAGLLEEKEKEGLKQILAATGEICSRADELSKQLTAVLSQ